MKIYHKILYFILSALMLANCQKEERAQIDISPPLIDIVEPVDASQYPPGSSLSFLVELSENQELHEYSVVLRNADRSYTKTLSAGHLHATAHQVEDTFTLPNLNNQVYTLTVKASDHNDNLASESVTLIVE